MVKDDDGELVFINPETVTLEQVSQYELQKWATTTTEGQRFAALTDKSREAGFPILTHLGPNGDGDPELQGLEAAVQGGALTEEEARALLKSAGYSPDEIDDYARNFKITGADGDPSQTNVEDLSDADLDKLVNDWMTDFGIDKSDPEYTNMLNTMANLTPSELAEMEANDKSTGDTSGRVRAARAARAVQERNRRLGQQPGSQQPDDQPPGDQPPGTPAIQSSDEADLDSSITDYLDGQGLYGPGNEAAIKQNLKALENMDLETITDPDLRAAAEAVQEKKRRWDVETAAAADQTTEPTGWRPIPGASTLAPGSPGRISPEEQTVIDSWPDDPLRWRNLDVRSQNGLEAAGLLEDPNDPYIDMDKVAKAYKEGKVSEKLLEEIITSHPDMSIDKDGNVKTKSGGGFFTWKNLLKVLSVAGSAASSSRQRSTGGASSDPYESIIFGIETKYGSAPKPALTGATMTTPEHTRSITDAGGYPDVGGIPGVVIRRIATLAGISATEATNLMKDPMQWNTIANTYGGLVLFID